MAAVSPRDVYYLVRDSNCEFEKWLSSLDSNSQFRIDAYIDRFESGHRLDIKKLNNCEGCSEIKMDFGPGYRAYFNSDAPEKDELTILLRGGTKRTQSRDIKKTADDWRWYKKKYQEAKKKNLIQRMMELIFRRRSDEEE